MTRKQRHNVYLSAQTWAYLNKDGQPSETITKLVEEKMTPITVTNINGKEIDYEAAVNLMNDILREELADEGFDTAQSFFRAYEIAHLKRFAEEWELSKANPVW